METREVMTQLDNLMPLFLEQFRAGKSVIFSPRGVSMLPMLRQGIDSVVLSPLPGALRKYDLPLYRYPSGKYVLHRIVKVQEEAYLCMGDNTYSYETVEKGCVIAVVTAFRRGSREISVTNPGYRLYCRFWHYSRPLRHFWRRGMGWLRRHLK